MKLLKKVYLPVTLVLNFLITKLVLAATDPLSKMIGVRDKAGLPQTTASPQRIIVNVIVYVLGFVALFFVISIIYAGWQWMSSGGNEEKISAAKKRLLNSIIGIIIVMSAYGITWYIDDVMTKATIEGYYYGYGEGAPESCNNDSDCERYFGPNWTCQESEYNPEVKSCLFNP